ncbi:hypothetical protein WA026_014836 [Henosepilachna vigintioctopunctata]|uniref:ABC-type glutathione-S-conjugate transporter n=1 Tax=Henosepilachna vigintioctopunctata TaxID=420089 RepID=A0AAW1UZW9_9CUCU
MNFKWLDNFCNSTFWNTTLTWNTSYPELTSCFERTVLVWIPCIYLWMFSGVEIYYYIHSRKRKIYLNWLNTTKFFMVSSICSFIVVRAIWHIIDRYNSHLLIRNVDIVVPITELITYLLVMIHMELNRRMGFRTSGILFIFWFFCTFCGALKVYSVISKWNDNSIFDKSYIFQYTMTLCMFVLNCFADYPSSDYDYKRFQRCCPEEGSSFLSRILFSWFTPLAWQGYKNLLEVSDLWDLRLEDMTRNVVPLFDKHWKNTQKKCGNSKPASVLPALVKSFGMTNLMGAFLKIIQDSLTFVSPFVLRWLINFVNEDEEMWKGFLYAFLLYAAASVQTLFLSQYFYRMFIIGVQVRTALISAIYRKSLRISCFCRKDNTIGEIVNLMAVDTQNFVDLLTYLNMIWSSPFQIIFSLILLWQTLGISVIAGVTTLIILIPLNTYIVNKTKTFQIKQMEYKDERIKVTNEVLSGIKILKLYAWELNFEDVIQKIRAKELYERKKASFMNAGSNFIWTCAPFLVSFVTFATYVFIDENNVLDATTAFVSISLFNILRFPMSMLPNLMSNIAQTAISLKRINKFMNLPEIDPRCVSHESQEDGALIIKNGNFAWGNEPILKNIDIKLPKGSLTAIIGHVGSGKSSLISALLGEMEKKDGQVNTIGTIAYVSQQAWIQNATLKNNILFGRKYNKDFYNSVVEACALKEDFQMLPGGDQTEIGEKGINLSGGQKQRVNIARAVYAQRDIYLFDDPLSAVDCHVAEHLFDRLIGPKGLLRNKTRVLSTHHITYLPQVDQLLVLKNGCISERGTYQELVKSKGAFAEFLEQHLRDCTESDDDIKMTELTSHSVGVPSAQILLNKLQEITNEKSRTNTPMGSLRLDKSPSIISREKSHYEDSIAESEHNFGQLTETEKMNVGGVSLKIYKQYIMSIGPMLSVFILFSNVLYQALGVGSSFWLSDWSNDKDAIIPSKKDKYLAVYGILGLGQGIASFLLSFAFAQGFYLSSVKAHQILLSSCIRALQSFFDTTPLGRILNRFSNDMNCLDNTLPIAVYQAVTTLFVLAGTLFVISYNSPIFLVLILLTGIVYFFIQRIYQTTCRQLKRMESVSRSPIYSFFSETLTGTSVIRAFVQQERFISELNKRLDVNQICYFYGLVANRWLAVRLESIANLIILFTALVTVIGRDSISPGIVGLSVSYALQITQTLNWLVRTICDVETNIVAIERLQEYYDAPQEAAWEIKDTTPEISWPRYGSVRFENYSVRYRPGLDLVLKNIDVHIAGGEKVGIVGRTGAGKSSLTLCLFRIIEAAEGAIYIDGIDISKLGLHSLRSKITIIPQDAVLFSGTLRMNLDPFNKHTDEEIWAALEHANLKKLVAEYPNGLSNSVSESGENVSIGQRQLICLARALLRKTKLFILDEATAAVDLETDELIQKTIRAQFHDCTILTIAHRLNTVMDYDKIIVLDEGCIREFGTPQDLIGQRGIFYGMCKESKLI